jgi:hypothetical protein
MDAIESIINLSRERDEVINELCTYEDWFESLIGMDVTLTSKRKNHTRYSTYTVTKFIGGKGWEIVNDDDKRLFTFYDLISGKINIS